MSRNDIINTDGTIKWDTVGGFKDSIDNHTAQLAENEQQIYDYKPNMNKGELIYGKEYLSAFHKKVMAWTPGNTLLKAIFSGDSTTAGVSTSSSAFHIDQLINTYAQANGLNMLSVVNSGQSGQDTEHWNQTYVSQDLANNPDLYIVRWGINDPMYTHSGNTLIADQSVDNPTIDATRRTAEDFNTSLRAGLQQIRNTKDYTQLSVILMAPSSTYDIPNGRYSAWYESIIPYIKQAARDFQCCFIDTYQYLYDSQNASDNMDNPYNDGRHIHPNDVRNIWITNLLYDVIFPQAIKNLYGFNSGVISVLSTVKTKSVNDLPSTYPNGVSIYRCTDAPFNGQLITFIGQDGVVLQINSTYISSNPSGVALRTSVISGNVWDNWIYLSKSESPIRPTLQNGWVDYLPSSGSQAEYFKDNAGIVHLQGLIKSGTTTGGTLLFTLPTGYRPAIDRFFAVASNGTLGIVTVSADGTVKIQSGSNVYLSLDNVIFRAV